MNKTVMVLVLLSLGLVMIYYGHFGGLIPFAFGLVGAIILTANQIIKRL